MSVRRLNPNPWQNCWPVFVIVIAFFCLECAAFGSPSSLSTKIEIKKTGSPTIIIGRSWIRRAGDKFELQGYVLRNSGHDDTTKTHLLVSIFGDTGEKLSEVPLEFIPRQIPHRLRGPGSSSFKLMIDARPDRVRRVEIEARDDN